MIELLIAATYTVAMIVLGAILATAGLLTASIARHSARDRLAAVSAGDLRSEALAREAVVSGQGRNEERKVA